MFEYLLLFFASLFAGGIDSIVGGGGLILIPALFIAFPNTEPATLIGTNKSAGIWGTGFAATRYLKQVKLPKLVLVSGCLAGLVGSGFGALLLLSVPTRPIRIALPVILVLLLGYTLVNRELGTSHVPKFAGHKEAVIAGVIGFVVGVYDGFFGPGAGSFIIFAFARWLGYDFLHASASAKVINSATNLSAFVIFIISGNILWRYIVVLVIGNLLGALVGTKLSLSKGSGFVRTVFIMVVSVLIIKTSADALALIS